MIRSLLFRALLVLNYFNLTYRNFNSKTKILIWFTVELKNMAFICKQRKHKFYDIEESSLSFVCISFQLIPQDNK